MELTYDAAKATLVKLARERPNYIHTTDPRVTTTREASGQDNSCFYRFSDDTPGCIIGAMMAELFPDIRLEEGTAVETALSIAGITFNEATSLLVDTAQSNQDVGIRWAHAVEYAVKRVEG